MTMRELRPLRSQTAKIPLRPPLHKAIPSRIGAVRRPLMRELLGGVLRDQRVSQGRTLREVSRQAQVSLGYLSEIERGQKEASSELLASVADALDVQLSEVLTETADRLSAYENVAIFPVAHQAAA